MRRVYLSFLGLGAKIDDDYDYRQTVYTLNGKLSRRTKFVQAAEVELLGPESFDEILIVATEESKKRHFEILEKELTNLAARNVTCALVQEDMSAEGQWGWFEVVFNHIHHGDRLTVDVTHGYRAIPIIFSTAIHFLQRAKGIKLDGVYYGAFEKNPSQPPIVDMKDFFLINEWAEGVSRLVEDADARKLATLAGETPQFQAGELNDPSLVKLLEDLTNRIRNVDMHNVCSVVERMLAEIKAKEVKSSAVARILLMLVEDKYSPLLGRSTWTGRYDSGYFHGQLAFIRLLLDHKLYMQAFTAMRELIGSIGLIGNAKARHGNAEGRKQRDKAEVFVSMIQFVESEWSFNGGKEEQKKSLEALYKRLEEAGVCEILRERLVELVKYRNGFDHGWTAKPESFKDIPQRGEEFYSALHTAIHELEKHHFLSESTE